MHLSPLSLGLFAAVLLSVTFFVPCQSSTNRPTLYGPGDNVLELDVDSFNKTVYHTPVPFFVQFYSNWCGRCIEYKRHFVRLATMLKNRRAAIVVAVLNCADQLNAPICREHSIDTFPTLKYFHANAKGKDDAVLFDGDKRNLPLVAAKIAQLAKADFDEGIAPKRTKGGKPAKPKGIKKFTKNKAKCMPKDAMPARILWVVANRERIKQQLGPDGDDVNKALKEGWEQLGTEEKAVWEQKAVEDKKRFEKERAEYKVRWNKMPPAPDAPEGTRRLIGGNGAGGGDISIFVLSAICFLLMVICSIGICLRLCRRNAKSSNSNNAMNSLIGFAASSAAAGSIGTNALKQSPSSNSLNSLMLLGNSNTGSRTAQIEENGGGGGAQQQIMGEQRTPTQTTTTTAAMGEDSARGGGDNANGNGTSRSRLILMGGIDGQQQQLLSTSTACGGRCTPSSMA